MRDITLGQFFPGKSFLHVLDPRTKLLWTIFLMVMTFMVSTFSGYVFVGIFVFCLMLISSVPLKYYFKGLRPMFMLMILTTLINIFVTPGQVLVTIPYIGWSISQEGVNLAVMMVLRLAYLIIGTTVLTFTTSPIRLTDGIEKLLNPFRRIGVPAHEIAMMMTIALRFIPTLLEETDKIIKAQTARGADFQSGNVFKRAKALIPLLVPLFISAFRRADELAVAMESRCYRGGEGRTSLYILKFTIKDLYAFIFALLFLAIVILSGFLPI